MAERVFLKALSALVALLLAATATGLVMAATGAGGAHFTHCR